MKDTEDRVLSLSRKLLLFFFPATIGAVGGLGLYTFIYAQGISYLGNDPKACVNCHIMRPQYDGWVKSSHRHVATCNNCHAPSSFLGKYAVKAINGFNHSLAFTSGNYPESIRINKMNASVTESACRTCHAEITSAIDHEGTLDCVSCHRNVGHLH